MDTNNETTIKVVNNNRYILSRNIKVFPCAYRGYYNEKSDGTITTHVFDPEARSTTEANFTSTFHKLSNNKDSYVIAWVPETDDNDTFGTLKCVIGGYYFEIYNYEISNFFYEDTENDSWESYNLCIKVSDEDLSSSNVDSTRTTTILSSFANTESYLDIKSGNASTDPYIFVGLALKTDSEIKDDTSGISASLKPFIADYTFTKSGTVSEENKQINNYYLNDDKEYTKITLDKPAIKDTEVYTRTVSYRIDPVKLPITSLLDTAEGKYSLRMIAEDTEQDSNTTVAEGDYAIALGKHTKANGLASVAFGNNTEASGAYSVALGNVAKAQGNYAFAIGSNTTAANDGSVAFGKHTITNANNQVVIGQYNETDNNKAFIIANGNETTRSNKFTVSYDGDVKATGNLEISGNSDLNGSLNVYGNVQLDKPDTVNATDSSNNLILGKYETTTITITDPETEEETTTIVNISSSGSISVYGQTPTSMSDKVFSVSNTGKTYIDDETNATTSDGALKVAGGVRINKKLNVGETLDVAGNTILGGDSTTNVVSIKTNPTDNDVNVKITGSAVITNTTTIHGAVGVTKDTESNSKTTGAFIVTGGAGIGKNLNVGGDASINNKLIVKTSPATTETNVKVDGTLNVTGKTDIYSNITVDSDKTTLAKPVEITDTTANALKVSGDVTVTKNLSVGGATKVLEVKPTVSGSAKNVTIRGTLSASGATSVGPLTVGGTTNISGVTTITDTTKYSNTNNTIAAALKVSGGVHIDEKLHTNGDAYLCDNLEVNSSFVAIKKLTESSSATTGALVVGGGAGIAKDLNIGGDTTTKNLIVAGTDSAYPNKLEIGSTSTSNKGGELLIYGTGSSTVFEVDNKGETYIAGNVEIDGSITAKKRLTIDNKVTISATDGISGLSSLAVTGTIEAATFNAKSDSRLKNNIKDYRFTKSILELPIKQFEYNNDETHTKYIGCIAQDLQEICPELVVEDSNGFLSIQESKLIYALLQEVKELKEKVERLERR